MSKRCYVLIIAGTLLQGCGYQVAKLEQYEPGMKLQHAALLVVRIDNLDYLDIKRIDTSSEKGAEDPQALQTTPADVKTTRIFEKQTLQKRAQLDFGVDEYRITRNSYFFKPYSYAQAIYTIEPGTYYISLAGIDSQQCLYYTEAPGINEQGIVAYGAFSIQPGSVLYLGDIECQWHSSNKVKKFVLHDRLTLVKKDLQAAGLSTLAAKITPAKFYPKGTNLKNIE